MADKKNKRPFTKEWFIDELAERARFTKGDVRIILEQMTEIIKDVIYYEEELVLPGLFKVYVATIEKHEGYNPIEGKPMVVPESKRVVFRASRRLLELFDEKSNEGELTDE